MRHKNGQWRWIQALGRVSDKRPDGSLRLACGTHRDITERNERELELLQAKEAAEAVTVPKRFPANMSHEIRTR